MADDAAEVKIKLVLDDQAHAAGARVGADMGQLAQHAQGASSGMQALHSVWGVALSGIVVAGGAAAAAIAGIGFAAHAGFESALALENQLRSMTGTIVSTTGASFEAAGAVAAQVHDELEEVGIQAGVSSDKVQSAFEMLAQRSNKSLAEVEVLTEKMVQVGRVVPGGIDAISEGFANMEAGIIRARNPLVQMIANTGVLHGNAKQVAEQMQKMTPDKQMQLAEQAMAKMAERAKGIPLTFNELVQSLKDMKDNVFETLGGPILDAVTRVMGDVRSFFMAHRDQILAVAEAIGTRIGEWVQFVSNLFTEFISVFSDTDNQIGSDIQDAMEWAADQWDDIKNNAHAIAQTFRDIVAMAEKIVSTVATVARIGTAIVTMGASEVGIAVASYGYDKLTGGNKAYTQQGHEITDETQRALHKAGQEFEKMNVEASKLEKAKNKFIEVARASGLAADEIDGMVAGLNHAHEMAIEKGGGKAFDEAAAESDTVAMQSKFVAAYQAAAAAHNEGAMKHAAQVLETSAVLRENLLASGGIVADGLESLGSYVHDAALKSKIADQLKGKVNEVSAAGKGPTMNFNGGQTFHIKQDFRDQDPDRVALTFMDDIKAAAFNRNQSKLATAFGV